MDISILPEMARPSIQYLRLYGLQTDGEPAKKKKKGRGKKKKSICVEGLEKHPHKTKCSNANGSDGLR